MESTDRGRKRPSEAHHHQTNDLSSPQSRGGLRCDAATTDRLQSHSYYTKMCSEICKGPTADLVLPKSQRLSCPHRAWHTKALTPALTAFPFALSPEEAMRRVSFVAAATSFRSVRTLFRSFLASMGLGGEVLRPKVVKAAYLPVWFIDGHVGAKVSRETPGEEAKPPEVVNLVLQRSYVGSTLPSRSSHSANAQIHVRWEETSTRHFQTF